MAPWVLVIQGPTQTYSLLMLPRWIAQPGDVFSVMLEEDGWLLARQAGDACELVVWMRSEEAVRSTEDDGSGLGAP